MYKLIPGSMALIVALFAGTALAEETSFLSSLTQGKVVRFQFSPYTYHFTYDSEHSDVVMVGLEREDAQAKIDGITLFSNSFGQPTVYFYPWGGAYHALGGFEKLSFKWTAGLLYGYRDPYQNKVPYNHNGFSPAVIPAFAYDFSPEWSGQLNLLGNSAVMFQLSKVLK